MPGPFVHIPQVFFSPDATTKHAGGPSACLVPQIPISTWLRKMAFASGFALSDAFLNLQSKLGFALLEYALGIQLSHNSNAKLATQFAARSPGGSTCAWRWRAARSAAPRTACWLVPCARIPNAGLPPALLHSLAHPRSSLPRVIHSLLLECRITLLRECRFPLSRS